MKKPKRSLKPPRHGMHTKLPQPLYEKLLERSAEDLVSMQHVMVQALRHYLAQRPEERA